MSDAPNAGPEMDLETIYSGMGATAEIEALSIQAVLEANGIDCIVVGSTELPNLPYSIQVPQNEVDRARAVLEEARQAGPAAAEEAERAGEGNAQ